MGESLCLHFCPAVFSWQEFDSFGIRIESCSRLHVELLAQRGKGANLSDSSLQATQIHIFLKKQIFKKIHGEKSGIPIVCDFYN